MEFKFLMAALMPVMSSSRYEASPKACRLRWVKLNKTPVCFGTKGYQLGRFSHHRNIFLSSFMFVHRSGKVTCSKNDCSYWGCVLDANVIGVLLTDENKYWLQKQQQLTGWMVQSGVLGDQSCFSPTNSSNFRGPLQSITLRCRAKNLQVT